MIEVPASHSEVNYWVTQLGAVLLVDQKTKWGDAILVLKSKKMIPVLRKDIRALLDRGWTRHLIHYSPPELPVT